MEIKNVLYEKNKNFLEKKRSIRKNITKNIFFKRYYIYPDNLRIKNYQRRPIAIFNPGAVLEDKKLKIFPRLIFDYYNYTSSVGFFELNIENILNNIVKNEIDASVILYPEYLWEFLGSEDARVIKYNGEYLMLYTGKGYVDHNEKRRDVLAFSKLDHNLEILNKSFFKISNDKEIFYPPTMKDSAFLDIKGDIASILTRLEIDNTFLCWKGTADLKKMRVLPDSLEPIMAAESWETKVGWSTNAIKVGNNYLVGWHAVLKEDLSYKNGFAIVDEEGNLLGISDYLLYPEGMIENYGDRAFVIFGDGLIKYGDYIIWVGGISDYAIGIFVTTLKDVMENIRII
ncbi:Predicted glycosyl hydrolase, GH43/DUF377 family [Marinitoga hydrogenitolerans DSM 16785]|uniref:Predicted glycosyl hydrolase, GH43/DUF377 family n=1 Tax=Marinitoga hydrogenitolerans (strain DSM 16785 / JCM 12826 / AT1271) TaxID=1122195 RepID=A0A1M4SHU5_MARH1|nr:hypothetical protein [Marinitoga hydrogenitolerans]SHE31567.1 Predicted glycosyl hydrolase, GH43/DUF377 family [Marinitoga hydrogenitolerans DSM 16785]